jgi:hypothetical protein
MGTPRALLGLVLGMLACSSPRNDLPALETPPDAPVGQPPATMEPTTIDAGSLSADGAAKPASVPTTGTTTGSATDAKAPDTKAPAIPCAAGTRACADGTCRPDDVAACGPACTACVTPANGRSMCSQGTCVFECFANFIKCDEQCLPASASLCCRDRRCLDLEHGTPACVDHHCAYECDPDYRLCEDLRCESNLLASCCGLDPNLDSDGNGISDCKESLLANGQFKTDHKPWSSSGDVTAWWDPMDGRGSTTSGSLKVTNEATASEEDHGSAVSPFVELAAGATYTINADYYIPAGQAASGYAEVSLDAGPADVSRELGRTVGAWTKAHVTIPVETLSQTVISLGAVRVKGLTPFTVYFDNVVIRR